MVKIDYSMDEDALYKIVGSKISTRRKSKDINISQDTLSKEVKMTRVSIVNIEAGRQHAPLHVLWKIAEILKIEVSELIPSVHEYSEYVTRSDPEERIKRELFNHPNSQDIIMSLYNKIKKD